MAAELHDEIGQQLTVHLLQLDRMSRSASGDIAVQLDEATAGLKQTLEDVRTLAHRLWPEVPTSSDSCPPCATSATGLELTPSSSCIAPRPSSLSGLSEEEELVIYRVAQQGLTNARVTDDGQGMPAARTDEQAGGGLRGLRERALTIDAELHVGRADPGAPP